MKKFFLIIFFFFSYQAGAANPVLITTTLDGKKFDLSEQKNKVVIVNFWAKWCPECRKEMPVLDEVYKEYKSQGLEIIGISIDRKKYRSEVKKVAAEFSYPNSLIADAQEISFEEPNEIPLNYLINKNGELVKIIAGDGSKKDFEDAIKPLFSKR